jgi:hypothetical protein
MLEQKEGYSRSQGQRVLVECFCLTLAWKEYTSPIEWIVNGGCFAARNLMSQKCLSLCFQGSGKQTSNLSKIHISWMLDLLKWSHFLISHANFSSLLFSSTLGRSFRILFLSISKLFSRSNHTFNFLRLFLPLVIPFPNNSLYLFQIYLFSLNMLIIVLFEIFFSSCFLRVPFSLSPHLPISANWRHSSIQC